MSLSEKQPEGGLMENIDILFLRVFLYIGAVVSILLTLLLRRTADMNYKAGNVPIAKFETFLSFLLAFSALCACILLYYLDSIIPSL